MLISALLVTGGLIGLAGAQFPPEPEGITVLKSKFHENVTISFKEVRDLAVRPRPVNPARLKMLMLTVLCARCI